MRVKPGSIALVCAFCILSILAGCGPEVNLEKARQALRQSSRAYERAVKFYRRAILLTQDSKVSDQLHFELGKLYYDHRDFVPAVAELKKTSQPEAAKLLAISYYQSGDFTDALDAFNKIQNADDETLYYHGLTCEKLNLYDQALEAYKKIGSPEFSRLSAGRSNAIEKRAQPLSIKDVDPRVAKIIAAAPKQEDYPQAGGLILFCDEHIEITGSNTQISDLHYIIKILNQRGKEDLSEAQIEYDTTYEKVELEYARTIKPDGTIIDVGSRHIRDVSKYLNFPLYSNVHVYIISFPEISEGAVIEYKLKIRRNKLIDKKDFSLDYPLQASEPIISADFSLRLPPDTKVNIKTINDKYNNFQAALAPAAENTGGRTAYRWQFKNIPQVIPEANMPPAVEINPTIMISTFKTWEDVYKWWQGLSRDKIRADDAIKAKTAKLTQGLRSEEEKAAAIYGFCAQKIRYVAVEYGQAGYEPHKAEDILRNKYGDCKDKAVLLVAMLRQAGIKAYPVLISTRQHYDLNPDFPSPMFNHAIAAVVIKGKTIFLDPTAETCAFGDLPPDDQNRRVLVFREDGYKIEATPLYPAGHNLLKQQAEIKINEDESIVAKRTVFTHGMYDQAQRYWLLYTPPQLVEEALTEKIQNVSVGGQLEGYSVKNLDDLNKPLALSYTFKGREYLTSAGALRIIPQLAMVDPGLVAKDSRSFPVDLSILESQETDFAIEIPPSFSVKYLPESIKEDSPWMKFNVEYRQEGNKIYFLQRTELKTSSVSQADYPAFKNFFEGLAKKVKQRIVLEKKK